MARRLTLPLLAVAVLAVHLLTVDDLAGRLAAPSAADDMPARLAVRYVGEMQTATPRTKPLRWPGAPVTPLASLSAPGRSPRLAASPAAAGPVHVAGADPAPAASPAPSASASASAEAAPEMAAASPVASAAGTGSGGALVLAAPATPAVPAASADAATSAASATAATAAPSTASPPAAPEPAPARAAGLPSTETPPGEAEGDTFAWPASTRLSYRLTGQYRGEVNGSAQVEWVQASPRYQVHLDVVVGLSFAPLLTRRLSSDGLLGPDGLRPRRYDEETKLAFRDGSRVTLRMDDDGVLFPDGRRWTGPGPSTAGPTPTPSPTDQSPSPSPSPSPVAGPLQDTASQFVQLSYLFTRDPARLVRGHRLAFDLALPRRVARWIYEVGEASTQFTPFGPIDVVHVRPAPEVDRGRDLRAEAWFSPQLAYLPVRIRIEQAPGVFIDLVLDRRPALGQR